MCRDVELGTSGFFFGPFFEPLTSRPHLDPGNYLFQKDEKTTPRRCHALLPTTKGISHVGQCRLVSRSTAFVA